MVVPSLDARFSLIVRGRDEGERAWYILIMHVHLLMNLLIMYKQESKTQRSVPGYREYLEKYKIGVVRHN